MISGVILNWKRPANVRRILDSWQRSELVTDAIVWNNNPFAPFDHPWATVINCNLDCGLYTRFNAMLLAKNNCILMQDDDLEISATDLRTLYKEWAKDKYKLHGIFGRKPKPDNSYAQNVHETGRAPIVLTRILMSLRTHAIEFFKHEQKFRMLQAYSKPDGNGEDIIFSYVSAYATGGGEHYIHKLKVNELPAPDAIHNRNSWGEHCKHRTKVMQACQSEFAL